MNDTKRGFGVFAGLQTRLLLIIILGAVIFSIAAGLFAYHLGEKRGISTSQATLTDLAQAVEKTVAIGAFASDSVLLAEVVNGLARNSLVALVQVESADGDILAQNPQAEPRALNNLDTTRNTYVKQVLYSPFDEKEIVGFLLIYAHQDQIAKVAKQEALTLAWMMVGQTALVAILIYAVVAALVSRPITRLAEQLRIMSPGTSERLETPSLHRGDEIGILINSANELLDSNTVALTRERELRHEIELMESQYRQIFDSSSAGIFVLDQNGLLINSNPTVSKVVGMSLSGMQQLKHDNFIERVFGQPDKVRAMVQESIRTGETVSGDLELVQKGDVRRWVHCLISVHAGPSVTDTLRAITTEGVMYDITERKSVETAVRYQADHDALTGLNNRASSHAIIERFLEECRTNATAVSVMCIDLDGFKQINDRYGHEAGDKVLIECALRMKNAVRRSTDLVGRLGGDEFVVALRDIGPSDDALTIVADAIMAAVCAPIVLKDGTKVQVGASIGIACAPIHSLDRVTLLDMADASMYKVKRTGKNTYAMAYPKIL
ncbi:sensor domain-containing diguanylate cyclase [Alteromonas sp. M12]|uniref:sensor domain-containing diguanylate cyclase n=1 Tax=Alteromonas sp. M12 TaxID=3135644 RepID=UPI00319DC8EF